MITPEQLAASNNGSEHGHQCALMQWSVINRAEFPWLELLFAIPNGGDRRPSVAASLAAEGVRSGVPDLFLPVPRGAYAGLWIEMKKPTEYGKKNGGRSDKQVEWHRKLIEQYYAVVTCYSWQAARDAILRYDRRTLIMPEGGDSLSFVV